MHHSSSTIHHVREPFPTWPYVMCTTAHLAIHHVHQCPPGQTPCAPLPVWTYIMRTTAHVAKHHARHSSPLHDVHYCPPGQASTPVVSTLLIGPPPPSPVACILLVAPCTLLTTLLQEYDMTTPAPYLHENIENCPEGQPAHGVVDVLPDKHDDCCYCFLVQLPCPCTIDFRW